MTTTDEELLSRIAAGDRLAMRVLFSRHQLAIHRFVLRLVRDDAVAEDAVSDTFLDVWKEAGSFAGRSRVSTWLMSIARFKALSALRRRRESGLDEDWAAGIADDADTPEVTAQKSDKGAVIRACIERLSAEHREVLDLVYYHEASIEEVAEIVGIAEGTVKTRLFHARRKLSELLLAAGIDRGWP
jgi:RNA polymerase sigma-70 factor (ECF subfamily)